MGNSFLFLNFVEEMLKKAFYHYINISKGAGVLNKYFEHRVRVLKPMVEKIMHPKIFYEDSEMANKSLDEPCVIICTHMRKGDGVVPRYAFLQSPVCSLVAKDIMDIPVIKFASRGCKCIPIDRKGAATNWIHTCLKELRDGNSVVIFPEGTTYKDKDIEDFKSGFVILAKMAGVKILPMAYNGPYKFFRKNSFKVLIGKPQSVESKGFTKPEVEAETRRFQGIVTDMYNKLNDDGENMFIEAENEPKLA